MEDMASSPSDYYDDPSSGDLTSSFHQVGTALSNSRLLECPGADCS
jgi:hypothetical protein